MEEEARKERETEVTAILRRWRQGDERAAEDLLPLVYEDLRAVAAGYLARERPDHTLQATELVHEAYLRLVSVARLDARDRAHFFSVAARAMRRILVDHARETLKRAGRERKTPLEAAQILAPETPSGVLDLHEGLLAWRGASRGSRTSSSSASSAGCPSRRRRTSSESPARPPRGTGASRACGSSTSSPRKRATAGPESRAPRTCRDPYTRMVRRTLRVYTGFEDAATADALYYAALTPQERLDLLLELVARQREDQEGTGEAAEGFERVYRVVDLPPG